MHLLDTHPASDLSRRDTTAIKAHHLSQLPLGADLGRRGWVRRALKIWVAESRADRAEVAEVIKRRHYLRRWPAPPKTLLLSYIASLGGAGLAGAVVMVGLLPTNLGGLLPALELYPAEVLTLARCWRSDDLTVEIAPDFLPEVLRRVIKRVASDWAERKCSNLAARPRLLVSFADPAVGHDGALYAGAGAIGLGGKSKLLFAWPLVDSLRGSLREYAARPRA